MCRRVSSPRSGERDRLVVPGDRRLLGLVTTTGTVVPATPEHRRD